MISKYTAGKQDCEPPMAVSFVTRLRPVLVIRRGESRRRRRKKKTKGKNSRIISKNTNYGVFKLSRKTANTSLLMSLYPSVRPSIHPHGTTWLPLDGFFMKFDI